ncbi:MAG: hypothetical protein CO189_07005 [candidate division Zixibacteria bacterium CG_4_9_14_3_um_filter_46_8]|nr:MAG: hypothetical protein CO189_07005 [candidate division Zixibacteria bacterium CG_4_9_14_3_um_filter_46_8]
MKTAKETDKFRVCSLCNREWKDRESFINDILLYLNGYQANFDQLELGWFLFTHHEESCGSTLAIPAGKFFDLYKGEKYTERKTGSEDCPGYCFEETNLERCPTKCACAFVREILVALRKMKEAQNPAPQKS